MVLLCIWKDVQYTSLIRTPVKGNLSNQDLKETQDLQYKGNLSNQDLQYKGNLSNQDLQYKGNLSNQNLQY
jgi:hypothetical protein